MLYDETYIMIYVLCISLYFLYSLSTTSRYVNISIKH